MAVRKMGLRVFQKSRKRVKVMNFLDYFRLPPR